MARKTLRSEAFQRTILGNLFDDSESKNRIWIECNNIDFAYEAVLDGTFSTESDNVVGSKR